MRLRVFVSIVLFMVALSGIATADTAVYDGTTYVYPGEAAAPATLTLQVSGNGFDVQTFEPIQEPALPGAVFGIYAKDAQGGFVPFRNPENPLEPLTITSGMTPVTVALPTSVDLYIHQESAPEGYAVGEDTDYTLLSLPQTLEITNQMAGLQGIWLELRGVGMPSEEALAGVSFALEGPGGTQTLVTDAEGRASLFGIDPGAYTLRQKAAPEGYSIDEEETSVVVKPNEPAQVSLRNSLNGTLSLRALGLTVDGNRTTRLIPVERKYEVFDEAGTSHGVMMSGETMSLRASQEGARYTLRAVDAPSDGYTADAQAHEVTLYAGRTATYQTVVKSEKGFFQFSHVAADTAAPVSGGTFALYDANGDEVYVFEADASGAYRPQVPLVSGPYTIRMLHVAEGHQFNGESLSVRVEPFFNDGYPVAEAVFASDPVPAALYEPVVAVDTQALPSLFAADAEIDFTLSVFDGNAPLPIKGLDYSFALPDIIGMEALETTDNGARMHIARRLPLEGVEKIDSVTVTGTVSYSFEYQIDADGTEQTVPISLPFETTVATFAPMEATAPFIVTGHVYDENGELIIGHRVTVEDEAGNTVYDEMLTDPFGAYAFSTLPDGAQVRFHPEDGYGVKREGGDAHILPLKTITGKVTVEGDLSGYPVTLSIGEAGPVEPESNGSFTIIGIFDDMDTLVAEVGEDVLSRVSMQGSEAEVVLCPAASIAGTAKDPDGTPVEGVRVTLAGNAESREAITDAYGKYSVDNLFPGDYTLVFAAPDGYVINGQPDVGVTLAAGEAKRGVDSNIMLPAAIDGVLWDGEAPYEGVTITLQPGFHEVVTDEAGAFSFEGLSADTYTLTLGTPQETIVLDMPGETTLSHASQRESHSIHTVRPASLSGRVWGDTNDDGFLSPDEVGLAGVEVILQDDGEAQVASVVTEEDGDFAFTGLTPGRYRLVVVLPESMIFARAVSDAERILAGLDDHEGASEWYTLTSGEARDDLVCGAIMPGSAMGVVWEDVDGNGLLDAEEPTLEGVSVELLLGGDLFQTVLTDAEGGYRFEMLRAGDYSLRVTLPEGCMFTVPPVGEEIEGLASDVPKNDGRAAEIDLDIRRAQMDATVNIGAQRSAMITAHVWFDKDASGVDPGGVGYEGLEAALYAANGTSETLIAQRETDAAGNVAFERIRPGTYQLRYSLPETKGWGFTAGVDKTAESTGTSKQVVLANGAHAEAESVGITQMGFVSGMVFEDADYDGLRGESEFGIVANVELLDANGEVLRQMETRSNGEYIFDGIPSGRYNVRFTLTDAYAFTNVRVDAPSFNSDVPETKELSSETGMLFLPMGESLLVDAGVYRRASVSGSVWQDMENNGLYFTENLPIADIDIALLRDGETVAETVSSETGGYRFDDLSPGEYVVAGYLPEGMRFSQPVTSGRRSMIGETEELDGFTNSFRLKNGENKGDIDVGIVYTGSVVGSAMDFLSGGGLPGVSVSLLRDNLLIQETVTVDGGLYRFDDLRPGPAEVWFDAPDTWIISEEETNPVRVNVPQGADSISIGIQCIPEATLGGSIWLDEDMNGVIDEGETPLSGIQVALCVPDGDDLQVESTKQASEDGVYLFDGLLPGIYVLRFETDDGIVFYYGEETEQMTLTMGEARQYDASAYIASTISGQVWEDMNSDGMPDKDEPAIEGAIVALVVAGDTVVLEMETDEAGGYSFENVPPVECAVRVTLPSGYMFTTPAEGGSVMPESDDGTAMTDMMQLKMGDVIDGISAGALRHTRVGDLVWLDQNGNGLQETDEPGIPGIEVQLWQGEEQLASTETDANGHYRFDALRPGEYHVLFVLDEQYVPTRVVPGLDQINSKIPWEAAALAQTEPFVARSGKYMLSADAGLVPMELAITLGWTISGDGTIVEEAE